jgi:6-phosphogluconate dehydrogenase (decarboxylating)
MIHNGIEYADMQLIAEAYDLIRHGTGKTPAEIADIFAEWNTGELESYLIEITSEVLRQTDAKTGKPLVDVILDQAGAKGTGAWTVQTALDLGIPVSGIAEAVFARSLSSKPEQRAAASGLPGPKPTPVADTDAFVEDVRLALYASKIIAYSQGFDEIVAGAAEYNWDIHKGDIAKIWRGGCIIRAQFLNRITEAYAADPGLVALVTAPYFTDAVARAQDSWRRVVAAAAASGIPSPAFSSSLAYYDGLRAKRLPAALVQGQRDFFGAHTYQRVDMPGTFHTLWSGDRTEIDASDAHGHGRTRPRGRRPAAVWSPATHPLACRRARRGRRDASADPRESRGRELGDCRERVRRGNPVRGSGCERLCRALRNLRTRRDRLGMLRDGRIRRGASHHFARVDSRNGGTAARRPCVRKSAGRLAEGALAMPRRRTST